MNCKKCGKKISKNVKFCTNCGEKVVLEEEVKETKKTAEKVVAEKVDANNKAEEKKVEVKTAENKTSGLAIAGMILGIIGLLLSFFIGPFAFLFPLLGLIFSIVSKNGKGFKIAGIITSIVALLIEIVILLLGIFVFSSIFSFIGSNPDYFNDLEEKIEEKVDDYDYDYDYDAYEYKAKSPYGTWTCAPFSTGDGYNIDVDDADDEDKTTLKLHYTDKYEYGPYEDLYNNHYSGGFSYEIETDKNEQNKSNGYKFIMVKGEVDEFMKDGIKESTEDKALNFEMELFKEYKYDKALIIFPSTYNMYICER